ncbi:hypothetical protein [Bradyrhizobium sp. BR 10289]|uniref:hypothetical protein n=1 Tax=Bradyrhizobium sp. BR 10289 TaxID=2749993 RepID=UPI001C64F790|nr:hypothetical protein [Bradyrhizobium sp. BR 10289]MBW7968123.1 hypothetical protein [Bradyrhizobium sp. BR 10289]
MSFFTTFTGRSRTHALQLLEKQKAHLPVPVFDYIAIAINNLPPPSRESSMAVRVKAQGHLCSGGDGPYSTLSIEVEPLIIPD